MSREKMRDRIFAFAAGRFGTRPEYLWSRLPDCAVLRCSNNGRWYAVVMDVEGSRLGLPDRGKVDIIDVKCSPMMTGSLLAMKGILPAYHMNKENWITILLDGTVEEEQITALLEMSHEISSHSGSGRTLRTEPREWLIPASPAMYDVEQDFRRDGTIIWKQTANYIAGDTVFIYMAAPVSAILYKCTAIEADIPYKYDNGSYHIRKAVKLKLLHRFTKDDMPLSAMKELGVSAVRGPRGVPDTLSSALKKLCRE